MSYVFQKRAGGSWYVGYRDDRGINIRRKTAARSKTEAERIASELERNAERVRLGIDTAAPGPTSWREMTERYLKEAVPLLASRAQVTSSINVHLLDAFGTKLVGQVTAGDVRTFIGRKTQQGMKPGSIEQLRLRISAIYSFAAEHRLTRHNPAAEFGKVAIPESAIRHLEAAQISLLMAEVPQHWRIPVAIGVACGLRKGEVAGLRKDDVDLNSRRLLVARQYEGRTTKTKRVRDVAIPDVLVPALRRAVEEATRAGVDRLFPDIKPNTPMHRVVAAAAARAGLAHLTFKDLRSTWATLAMEATGDLQAVQRGLGHSSPQMTATRYARFSAKRALQVADKTFSHPALSGLSEDVSPGSATPRELERFSSSDSNRTFSSQEMSETYRAVDSHAPSSAHETSAIVKSGSGQPMGAVESHSALPALSPADAARLLQVSVATIRSLIRSGKLTAFKRGKFVRIERASIEALRRPAK